jgi:hypothetical protein
MDVSAFDFSAREIGAILDDLAPLAKTFEIEPRVHQADEMSRTADGLVPMHEGLVGPTFRIRIWLNGADNLVARLAALELAQDVSVLLDQDGSARIKHSRASHTAA